ncbi:MAG: type secretion system protein [Proteobacteria bacterium]|nr:type secretion system protein [Pseudomonadota bacterium]
MKRLPRRVLITVLAVFALFGVIRAPASLVTLWLPKTIQLKNVEGSLWNGSLSAIGVDGMIVQERVEWHFRPQALISGALTWAVSGRFGEQTSALNLALRATGAQLNEVSVYLPLEPLAALHPKLKMAQLGALLHVTSGRLSLSAPIKAAVDVDRAFSALAAQSGQFGSYRFELDVAADGKGRWTLSSSPGLLGATGQGQFDVNRSQVDGRLVLTPSAPIPGLSPLLTQLPRAGDGYLITL